ncbi:MAG: hypothetical protein KDD50_12350 [Bdellovibrionales bacterium]|nr:hypothetical protein [Bdellovibrionales bacterium]
MSKFVKPKGRTPQVIKALYDYGPLDVEVLTNILEPEIKMRRTQDCLYRLVNRGLVIRCNKIQNTFAKNYFQLCASKVAKIEISKILNCDQKDLNIPNFRAHDIEHSIACAYWSNYFEKHFPKAKSIRDFHISSDSKIMDHLMMNQDVEFYPDITVSFKSETTNDFITIAVEIEKTPKTRKRIFHKLNKFSTRSYVDGVIYICPNHALIDLVGGVYSDRIKTTARRIRQYGEYFLMFTNSFTPSIDANVKMFSSTGQNINLQNWINILETNLWQKRRNEMFALQR